MFSSEKPSSAVGTADVRSGSGGDVPFPARSATRSPSVVDAAPRAVRERGDPVVVRAQARDEDGADRTRDGERQQRAPPDLGGQPFDQIAHRSSSPAVPGRGGAWRRPGPNPAGVGVFPKRAWRWSASPQVRDRAWRRIAASSFPVSIGFVT